MVLDVAAAAAVDGVGLRGTVRCTDGDGDEDDDEVEDGLRAKTVVATEEEETRPFVTSCC